MLDALSICRRSATNSSLSALTNLPGGGTIVLGLDERTGFRPVRLADPQAPKQGLATKARHLRA